MAVVSLLPWYNKARINLRIPYVILMFSSHICQNKREKFISVSFLLIYYNWTLNFYLMQFTFHKSMLLISMIWSFKSVEGFEEFFPLNICSVYVVFAELLRGFPLSMCLQFCQGSKANFFTSSSFQIISNYPEQKGELPPLITTWILYMVIDDIVRVVPSSTCAMFIQNFTD